MNKISLAVVLTSLFVSTGLSAAESTNLSPNSGFSVNSAAIGTFQYSYNDGFLVPNWIFDGGAGIANESVAWGGEASTNSLAFLQNNQSSLTQIITSSAKTFKISFDTAQRGAYTPGSLDVYWDNQLLGSISPATSVFETHEFIVDGLPTLIHSLTFRQTVDADATIYVDNVNIISDPVPSTDQNGFSGLFQPSAWSTGSNAPVNLVDTSAAPSSITLSNYSPWNVSGATIYFDSAPADGTVTFDYTITNSTAVCPAGYYSNGVTTMLPEGSGSSSFSLVSGETFGFALNGNNDGSDFGCVGGGNQITFEISSFSFVDAVE